MMKNVTMTRKDMILLENILIRCIGDHRCCPLCNKAFVPIGPAENMALKFYVKHFKNRKAK
jgi:hypothetical protein